MRSVSLADAKTHLSALIDGAEAGETVCITRHGKAVAKLVPVATKRKPIDMARLKALTDSMPMQDEDGGTFMRRLRDDARY